MLLVLGCVALVVLWIRQKLRPIQRLDAFEVGENFSLQNFAIPGRAFSYHGAGDLIVWASFQIEVQDLNRFLRAVGLGGYNYLDDPAPGEIQRQMQEMEECEDEPIALNFFDNRFEVLGYFRKEVKFPRYRSVLVARDPANTGRQRLWVFLNTTYFSEED